MIFIPEIQIYNTLNLILKHIKDDYNSNVTEETLLYRLLKGNEIEGYDYFLQATNLFLRDETHSRKINTTISFNAQKANVPTIHITLPSEQTDLNGINVDQGIYDSYLGYRTSNDTLRRCFTTKYDLLITSDNSSEVLLIYHVLRACLISFIPQLETRGFMNIKLSGQDIRISSEFVPNMFMKSIGLSFSYEINVPSLEVNKDVVTYFLKPNFSV